jgi:hypothetical protein
MDTKTVKPIISITDATTGETIEREMNAEELTQWEADKAKAQKVKEAEIAAEQAKTNAQAKLNALGLTTEDLKALGL